MLKNPVVRVTIGLAIIGLIVLMVVEGNQQPDAVELALERAPAGCEVMGAWRDEEWHESLAQFRNTTILCEHPGGARQVIIVYDGDDSMFSSTLDGENRAENGDIFVLNPDGSLTIGDDEGEIKTLN